MELPGLSGLDILPGATGDGALADIEFGITEIRIKKTQ
jgi:hypothetical protein